MKNSHITIIALTVFALVIGFFGANQILHADKLVATAPSFLPAPKIFIYFTGAVLILGAISFIIDRFARLFGYLIALILLVIVFTVHIPGMMQAPDSHIKMLFLSNALKDTAIAMGAIVIGNLSKH